MAAIKQCDQCRKTIPDADGGGHTPGWIQLRPHRMVPGEAGGPFSGGYCPDGRDGGAACETLDLCGWRCAQEYVTARALVELPPQLPGTA